MSIVEAMRRFKPEPCSLGCARTVLVVNGRVEIACSIWHIHHKESLSYQDFLKLVEEQECRPLC